MSDRNEMLSNDINNAYIAILKEELRPAMGCTEPIAIAYAAAKAREVLGALPDRLVLEVSGNIIKNVKSVVVPHTGGLRGIPAAAAVGTVAGDADAELEVISRVAQAQIAETAAYLDSTPIAVHCVDTPHIFDIQITAFHGEDSAFVRIVDYHTNLVCIRRNGETLLEKECVTREDGLIGRSCLSVEGIVAFADTVNLGNVQEVLERQIAYNMDIAEEGLRGNYGANIGSTILLGRESDINCKMRAWAAAASDARMNGCEKPVVINSGSGNQGLTVSVPVAVYVEEYHKTQEELYRALVVSNLTAIHQKTTIGKLSAFCGAVTAGAGAGAGIAWLLTQDFSTVAHTIVNALAIVSGIICDGAKASCAAKIASAVDAGIMGFEMYRLNRQFYGGDGIVAKGVENTIRNVGLLGHDGMRATDEMILKIMIHHT